MRNTLRKDTQRKKEVRNDEVIKKNEK